MIVLMHGLPLMSLSGSTCVTLHSREQGLSATRGGLTSRQDAISRWARGNSLSPCGNDADVTFMFSRSSQVGMFQTNSPVSSAKVCESFLPLLENASIGGASATALKKESGARLIAPDLLIVKTQPIGRAAISALNGSCDRIDLSRLCGS